MSPCSRLLSGNRFRARLRLYDIIAMHRRPWRLPGIFSCRTRDFSRARSRTSASDRAILGATMQRERPVSVSCTSFRPCVRLHSFVMGSSGLSSLSFALGYFACAFPPLSLGLVPSLSLRRFLHPSVDSRGSFIHGPCAVSILCPCSVARPVITDRNILGMPRLFRSERNTVCVPRYAAQNHLAPRRRFGLRRPCVGRYLYGAISTGRCLYCPPPFSG